MRERELPRRLREESSIARRRDPGDPREHSLLLADAGYWHQVQMQNIVNRGLQVSIAPDASKRKGTRPGCNSGAHAHMRRVLQSDFGSALYRKRQAMIEPVFGHTKFNAVPGVGVRGYS